jgi:spore germination protein GerM
MPKYFAVRAKNTFVLAILVTLTVGCSFGPENTSQVIPESQQQKLEETTSSDEIGSGLGRVYLQRTESTGGSILTGVQRNLSTDPFDVVQVLLNGPIEAEQDAGLRSAIPASTELLSARYVASDLVRVDLTSEIFQATGDDLVSSVAQIVLSLCDIPGIQRVIIVVNGQVNEWPKGDGSLTSQPLTAFDFPGRAISSQPAFPAIIKVQAE